MLESLFSSFSLVALSEMGDKTQLLAFTLAARFRKPLPVLAGILVATLLNHGLAASMGSWLSAQIKPQLMNSILGVLFIGFGLWTLKPDTLDQDDKSHRLGPFLTTALLFFMAEMGDKTQMATLALGASYASSTVVTLGTTLGMMVSDGIVVILGDRIAHRLHPDGLMKWLRLSAASLFFAFGLWSLLKSY